MYCIKQSRFSLFALRLASFAYRAKAKRHIENWKHVIILLIVASNKHIEIEWSEVSF